MNQLLNQLKYENQKHIFWFLFFFSTIILLTIGKELAALLQPLVLGGFFAYTMNPLIEWVEKRGIKSDYSIPLVFLTFIIILVALIFYFYFSLNLFFENHYDGLFVQATDKIENVVRYLKDNQFIPESFDINKKVTELNKMFKEKYIGQLAGYASTQFSFLGLTAIYTLIIIFGIKSFKIKTNRAFDKKKAYHINKINAKIITQVQQYMLTKTYLSLLTGISVFLVCLFFGIHLPFVWAILGFILNYIPRYGSIIAGLPPILLSLIQLNETNAIAFISIFVLAQAIIGQYLEPMLFTKRFSLSSIIIFFGVIFWGWYWNVVGVFLAVPIMVIISIIFQNIPALRPISVYLHSTNPLKEDEERLSLIFQVMSSDKLVDETEKAKIQTELSRDIYDKSFMKGYWKSIEKNPLSIEDIFENKTAKEKVELYRLAVQCVIIDGNVHEEEVKILHKIQEVAMLSSEAVVKIHKSIDPHQALLIVNLISSTIPEIPDYEYKSQMAFSIKEFAKKHFDLEEYLEAKKAYQESLNYFIKIEEQKEIEDCIKQISALDLLVRDIKN